jgi:hypothetical protein
MSAEQARQRVNVTEVHGALYASENASVHPGRLVRGLGGGAIDLRLVEPDPRHFSG